jgi:raffinose/stachyose/melibiose transport system permease protein
VATSIPTTHETAGAAAVRQATRGRHRHEWWIIVAFVAPALAVYGLFVLYPIVQSIRYSLYEWSGLGANSAFIGLNNYRAVLHDSVFWKALRNNAILVVASIAIQLPIGLALAMLVSTKLRGMRLFRTIYFFPLLMSTVAIGLLWNYIYDPTFGLLNATLGALHLTGLEHGWLGEQQTALAAVIAVICWQFIPFYMILFIAGLTTIPPELIEAARLDGASAWKLFVQMTLPLLRPVIRAAAILSLIGSLKYFDLIYVMTGGGPNNSTQLMATYMYKQAFAQFNMGYGSMIAVLLFAIAFVVSALVLFVDQRRAER